MRTQLNIPTTTLPPPPGDAPRNPLDEDLTTCTDALAGLKRNFKHQRISMKKYFQQFDHNDNGWISRKELDTGLRRLGFELSDKEVCHLARCMGVREYEEGITREAFAAIVCDDTVDTLEGIRGDVNDGRAKSKLGQTLEMPKGIQPNHGDPVKTPHGNTDWIRIDPDHRINTARQEIYRPGSMSNTLHPDRSTQDPPKRLNPTHSQAEAVRESLGKIMGWVEERGVGGAFGKLDVNQNQYV